MSVGIIGVNDAGAPFWHAIAPAGAELPTPPVRITSTVPGPASKDIVLLASCRNPAFSSRAWLPQAAWEEADLALHEMPRVTQVTSTSANPADRHEWAFTLQDRDPTESLGLLLCKVTQGTVAAGRAG